MISSAIKASGLFPKIHSNRWHAINSPRGSDKEQMYWALVRSEVRSCLKTLKNLSATVTEELYRLCPYKSSEEAVCLFIWQAKVVAEKMDAEFSYTLNEESTGLCLAPACSKDLGATIQQRFSKAYMALIVGYVRKD